MCFLTKLCGGEDQSVSGPLARRATGLKESVIRASKHPATPPSPTATSSIEQPKDDASIIRLFSLIDSSITDHVLNYYISSNSGSDKFSRLGKNKKELGWLRAAASNSSLKEARTQVIVIRAVIGAEVFKAIRDGYFVPARKPEAKRQSANSTDHKLRTEYFQSLPKNRDYHQHREKAIDRLAAEIMRMTLPLVSDTRMEETRLKSLKHIIENAADFAVTIGKQKPSFQIIFPQIPKSKAPAPASQQSSQSRPRKSRSENHDMPVLVPELRKCGDERGADYDKELTLVPVQRLPEGF